MNKEKITEALKLQLANLDLLNNGDYKHNSVLSRYYNRLKKFINDFELDNRF